MSVVAIYGFHGTFVGPAEHQYKFPVVGASHKCMLFLLQDSTEPCESTALAECAKYGFGNVASNGFGLLQVEVLNSEQFKGFAGFYEEALREGSSLVYYPN